MGSISFGCSLVTDRSRVPSPAAGITAFLSAEVYSSKGRLSAEPIISQNPDSVVNSTLFIRHDYWLMDLEKQSSSVSIVEIGYEGLRTATTFETV
jgi:hypothetical protein